MSKCLLGRAIVLILLPTTGCVGPATEPRNLDMLKDEIRAYVDSGRYLAEIGAKAREAGAWLEQRAARRGAGERLAMVFDLDETLLSNWAKFSGSDLGGDDAAWDAWMDEGNAPAIEPVRQLYRQARTLRIDVIFLTSRREHLRTGTENNLRALGCTDYAALVCRPEGTKGTVQEFKAAERARLVAKGFIIIANIGDQESDLAGGNAEQIFKLPDPFYFTQ